MDSNIDIFTRNKFYEIFDLTDALKFMKSWKDIKEIRSHGYRVACISSNIANTMKFNNDELEKIRFCSLFHDIGKLFIKTDILNKTNPLTNDEYEEIKKHVVYSKDYMVRKGFVECADIVLYHHERIDGSGYFGLRGNEIPLLSCIIAIADVYDALSSDRTYRKAFKKEDALNIIRQEKQKYNRNVYKIFIELYG